MNDTGDENSACLIEGFAKVEQSGAQGCVNDEKDGKHPRNAFIVISLRIIVADGGRGRASPQQIGSFGDNRRRRRVVIV